MVKGTGVPKLRDRANCQQWFFRLKTYMMSEGTWDAVISVPHKIATVPSGSSDVSGQYADAGANWKLAYDEDPESGATKTTYHPQNNRALHHILQHCEDKPAISIEGIGSASEAMNTLIKVYGEPHELEKFVVAERLWTTTLASSGSMMAYADQFTQAIKDVKRLEIDLDFILRSLMIYQLSEQHENFQEQKREAEPSNNTMFEEMTSLLPEEELGSMPSETSSMFSTPVPRPKKQNKHNTEKCRYCKYNPKTCWFAHPEVAPESWRQKFAKNGNKNGKKRVGRDQSATNIKSEASSRIREPVSSTTQSKPSGWILDSTAEYHSCNDISKLTSIRNEFSALDGTTEGIGIKQMTQRGAMRIGLVGPHGEVNEYSIDDVIYDPELPVNILSLKRVYARGGFKIDMDEFVIRDKQNQKVAKIYFEDHVLMIMAQDLEREK